MSSYNLDEPTANVIYKLQQGILKKAEQEGWTNEKVIYEYNRLVASPVYGVRATWRGLAGVVDAKNTSDLDSALADSKTPQGIVAELAFDEQNIPEKLEGAYLFLEDVQDPGNVGTIIRTADAAGYQGVFISSHSADIYNLKTLRSMQGSHFHLPIYRVSREEMLALARKNKLQLLASTLSEDSVDYQRVEKNEHFVLVVGNEGQGISQEMTDAADVLVHISMKGQAESLNVAVAAGILMFTLS